MHTLMYSQPFMFTMCTATTTKRNGISLAKRIFPLNFHVLSIFNRMRLYKISIAPQRIYHIHLQMCLDWMGQIIWLYVYVCVCVFFLLLRPQAMIFHKTIPLNDTHVFRIKTHIIFISYGLTHYEHVDVS